MNRENALNSLLERSNHLKSKLIKEQLRNNNFYFTYSEKYLSAVLNEYKIHKSIFKAASKLRFDPNMIMDWYIQGLGGNPKFRGFSLVINEINNKKKVKIEDNDSQVTENHEIDEGSYKISQYGDGWSYTTYIDGEKIFIISNELDCLKKKVSDKNLPLD